MLFAMRVLAEVPTMSALAAALFLFSHAFLESFLPEAEEEKKKQSAAASRYPILKWFVGHCLFSLTFSMGAMLFLLLIFEICDFMTPGVRWVFWRMDLLALCTLLDIVIPAAWGILWARRVLGLRTPAAIAGFTGVMLTGYWIVFWQFTKGDLRTSSTTTTDTETMQQQTSTAYWGWLDSMLESVLCRVAILGVAELAIMTGYGAVNFPLQQLLQLRANPRHVRAKRKNLVQLLDVIERKRQWLQDEEEDDAETETELETLSTPARRRTSSARSDRSEAEEPGASPLPLSKAVSSGIQWVTSFRVGQRGNHANGNGAADPTARATAAMAAAAGLSSTARIRRQRRARLLREEVSMLQHVAEEMTLELRELEEAMLGSRVRDTRRGKLVTVFAYVLTGFCLWNLARASWNVATHAGPPSNDVITTGIGVTRSMGMNLGSSHHIRLWSQMLSFLLIGVLVLQQTRSFLTTVVRLAQKLRHILLPTEMFLLLAAHVAGCYFVACVLLLRSNLPPVYRDAVAHALGADLNFTIYHRWFDTLFCLSAILTSIHIWVSQSSKTFLLSGSGGGADDEDLFLQLATVGAGLGDDAV